MNSYTAGYL